MSHRLEQIESTLQRALSTCLTRDLSDPRIRGFISITRIDVSPDLHDAYVYVSVMPREHERMTLEGLQHAAGFLQSKVRQAVRIKAMPKLNFRLDPSLKKQAEVLGAIREARERDAEDGSPATETETDPESQNSSPSTHPGPASEEPTP
ncbi:MAG: 30S ribosome-binding factor RbfA [Phycisphaeraceae bacterium]|nr:30S ribosome-binding factor RbfA [Phycisphaeraceae bacterium]